MKVRIGIDVGGTFTDAALINNETFELIGTEKIPTTHTAATGVAAGIIEVLEKIMNKYSIDPKDVTFIAHGTTQATNALLEGDVAKVGIVTLGSGLEGLKSKSDTNMGEIKLANSKYLGTSNRYVDTKSATFEKDINQAVDSLIEDGCESIVAAEAFSVDKPENEDMVIKKCLEKDIPGTATAEISKLYGLKVRTRTAVINASIMPKMLDTANMTANSIEQAGISAKLMVMRCDGGVMTVDDVREHPILTILSGPAAGVAGALMYEKLTDGIFLEVGGTSTDISCVKDGKVMIGYSQVGGHKTFLTSLDVRTVGIGGGSMIQIKDDKLVGVGPRSVHIAGFDYEVFTNDGDIDEPQLCSVKLTDTDAEYAYVKCKSGRSYALTLSGAANIAGYVKDGDYAKGNEKEAVKAWKPLADKMNLSVEEVVNLALEYAANKNSKVVQSLIIDYEMNPNTLVMVGGGGGASSVVPHLARHMGYKFRLAKNAPVISTIGVALALVRDSVERTIMNPTEEDILKVRKEAKEKAVRSGAAPDSVTVHVEVEPQKNIVRAIAIGNTELRSKDLTKSKIDEKAALDIVSDNLQIPAKKLTIKAKNNQMYAIMGETCNKKLFGLIKKKRYPLRLIDDEGIIRLQKDNAHVSSINGDHWTEKINKIIMENSIYGDGGKQLPSVYIVYGKNIINLSGLPSVGHMISVAKAELASVDENDHLICICTERAS
ncbi:hydantoinase/oxoprolinase family protein [Muricomes intestini]|jgi:N-methylhydantoinase A/oxoprolinase/acetone carboxylase beta subunit|uniref:hydantoinase/oxoprolinase family protein n=1 Tax=Muricomes intestini TaxID=1796634 RepID=UPI002FDE9BA8